MQKKSKDIPELYQDSSALVIATDSEWQGKKWISTQFSSKLARYIYITSYISEEIRERIKRYCDQNNIICISIKMTDEKQLLEDYLNKIDSERVYKKIYLLMFYSPKDLEYSIGWFNIKELIITGKLKQKRNVKNKRAFIVDERNIYVKDLKGWATGSLISLAQSCGIHMVSKSDLDNYKTKMFEAVEQMPEKFVDYAMEDVDDLLRIYDAFVGLVRHVQEIAGIKEENRFTEENIKMTTGSLVAKTIKEYIFSLSENRNLLQYCIKKLGLLDEKSSTYKYSKKSIIECKKYVKFEDFMKAIKEIGNKEKEDKYLKHLIKTSEYTQTAISQSSVKRFSRETNSSGYLALVQGGRCNNERPSEYYVEYGADIDLASCYGSTLRTYSLILGLPSIWAFTDHQIITLGKWLQKNEIDLISGLWYVIIDTELSFNQDLIYSKLVNLEEINRAGFSTFDKKTDDDDRDNDLSHIPGIFCLLRKNIRKGIITSDLLEVLRKVCSNQELKEIMNSEVISSSAYRKSNKVDNLEEWMKIVIEDKGTYYYKNDKMDSLDTRTRKWYGVELEGFIGKLVEERSRIKKDAELKALQETLKLFVNTSYGVIASPYFEISNTIIANNITARARLGAWMINKALHTRQSITDGGFYSLLEVPYLKEGTKLPGLEILSDNTKWKNKQYTRILKPLADLDWKKIMKEKGEELKNLDKYAKKHIDEFWNYYNLKLHFNIEHKLKNTFLKAAYWNKAHYIFITLDNTIVIKIRGARDFNNPDLRTTPIYHLLKNILESSDKFPEVMIYDNRIILKIEGWKISIERYGDENRPGDVVIEEKTAVFNNTHMFSDTEEEYLRRYNRKIFREGKRHELFEQFRHLGISATHLKMLQDILPLNQL